MTTVLFFVVISFLCFIFHGSNLKGLFKRFSVKKASWNFLNNKYKPWKMSMKELISLLSLILQRKNSFTGILKGLCLLICNTTFFFLTTDPLKTDDTRTLYIQWMKVRRKKIILSFQICKTIDFFICAFLRYLLYLWKRFLLFALIYTISILYIAISLENVILYFLSKTHEN